MIIRPARAADSLGIAVVHVAAWQEAYRGIVPQTYLDELSVAARAKTWTEILAGGSEAFVAESAGEIVGFVSFGKLRDEAAAASAGEVYAIYVLPKYWSTGLGRSLLDAALARLAHVGFALAAVWVLAANGRAIRFYERAGFSPSGDATVEIGGAALPEARYERAIAAEQAAC